MKNAPYARNVVPVYANSAWTGQRSDMLSAAEALAGINTLGLKIVGSGENVTGAPEVTAYWSEGFRHCSALITRIEGREGFDFAHCWPRAEELLRYMQASREIPASVTLVYGSVSARQHDIELYLAHMGVEPNVIQAETGGVDDIFGILFDVVREQVCVVREAPDQAVLHYFPFTCRYS